MLSKYTLQAEPPNLKEIRLKALSANLGIFPRFTLSAHPHIFRLNL
jgi:hypothetical protein